MMGHMSRRYNLMNLSFAVAAPFPVQASLLQPVLPEDFVFPPRVQVDLNSDYSNHS